MNILLVCPRFSEETFWSWEGVRPIIGRKIKAAFPPLGLLTVAAMLPGTWRKRVVDLRVRELTDEDIRWADYVFVSAMTTQGGSAREVIVRCAKLNAVVVLGGPILENGCEEFAGVSHFLLGEVENTLHGFVADLERGIAQRVYQPRKFPDISTSPVPLWSLVDHRAYASMLMQFCRGCPFKCTFCNVCSINGRVPRTKTPDQFLAELDALYKTGYRGAIMMADDDFTGNKPKVKELLRRLIVWQKKQKDKYPFRFTVEADITIADDKELMELMRLAGVIRVFLGLETPNKGSLLECGKLHNANRDMVACVKEILGHGLVVTSGFIVGFDADDPEKFDQEMIDFIQRTGIVVAMAGILQAPPGTELYARMQREGRLMGQATGNNTNLYPNFTPRMPVERLVEGYKRIVGEIYSPRGYYERICAFLRDYDATKKVAGKVKASDLKALVRSMWYIGVRGGLKRGFKTSYYYWKSLLLAAFVYPRAFPEVVTSLVFGAHLQEFARSITETR